MSKDNTSQPVVGILTVEVFDDWLEDLGMSLDNLINRTMGSWLFNYSEALQLVGVKPILYLVSNKVRVTIRTTHVPTGATLVVMPPPRLYRWLREWLPKRPKGLPWHIREGTMGGLRYAVYRVARFILRYVSTPVFSLFSELERDGCKSLLVQEYESARFDLCALVGSVKKVAVFGTFQGGLPHHVLLRPLRALALRMCAGLLIPAKTEANRVITRYSFPSEKVALTYTPVDVSVFHPMPKTESRKQLGLQEDSQIVFYHGQIHISFKGLDVLLSAWKRLCVTLHDRNMHLVLLGSGQDAEELRDLLTHPDLRHVHWVNEWIQDQHVIRRYLCAADVYVFPSRGDVCPNSVIEAMACGLPVVASNVNGINDIFEDGEQSGGLLVPPGDPDALAKVLDKLLTDSAFTQILGQHARVRAISAFSMERTGHQLRNILLSRTSTDHEPFPALTVTSASGQSPSYPSK